MTDTALLMSIIKNSGIKKGKIAEVLGISYVSLRRKINGEVSFTQSEIQKLCDLLSISDLKLRNNIFFKSEVDKTPTS